MKKIILFITVCLSLIGCSSVQYATVYTTIERIDYFSDYKGNVHQHIMLADGSSFTRNDHYFSIEDIGSVYMYDIPVTGKHAQEITDSPFVSTVYLDEAYMLKGCRYASFFVVYSNGNKESKVLAVSVINYKELETILSSNTNQSDGVEIPIELYNEICGYNPQE